MSGFWRVTTFQKPNILVRFLNGLGQQTPKWWFTIWKPDIFVWFSNGLGPQTSKCHSKIRPFNNWTCLDHLNTGLVLYSDGYCICLKRTLFPSRFLWSSARRLLPKFWQNVTVWSPIWVTLCRNRSRFSGVRRKMAPTQRTTIAKKKTTETELERDNYSTIGIQLLYR